VSGDVAWARSSPAIAVREVLLSTVFRPLISLYARRVLDGREHLTSLERPAIFVANHCSHMDTPLILRALPWRWRRRTGVAAAADYFYKKRLMAEAVSLAFNTVPVDRNGNGSGLDVVDRVLRENWSLVVFAEGTRSRNGCVGPLHSGAAVLSSRYEVPIVPVFVGGTFETMPKGRRWMRRAPGRRRQQLRVAFGPPIAPRPCEERREVMEQVRLFFASQGAATTPNKRLAARQERDTALAAR
jgi:1-acyl-sn-glycerol-3-phosphate acyltransferase